MARTRKAPPAAGEYTVLTTEDKREALENEARNLETQLFVARGDIEKHEELLAAVDAGQFADWDRRLVQQRSKEWKNVIQNHGVEIKKGEIALANVRRRLAELGSPPAADDV